MGTAASHDTASSGTSSNCECGQNKTCSKCSTSGVETRSSHAHTGLYGADVVQIDTRTVTLAKTKGLVQIKPEFGGYTHRRQLVVFGEAFYRDSHCNCCAITSEWKLFNIARRSDPGLISKRLHKEDRSCMFPAAMCASFTLGCSFFTVPCQKTVYMFKDHEAFHAAFITKGHCFGIACFSNGLAVSEEIRTKGSKSAEWRIQLYDVRGKFKSSITLPDKHFFEEPKDIAANRDGNKLFVLDRGKPAVFALDGQGQVLFKFTGHPKLVHAMGIAVDREGNVYCACGQSVIQVDAAGRTAREILTSTDNDTFTDVCFDHNSKNMATIHSKTALVKSYAFQKS